MKKPCPLCGKQAPVKTNKKSRPFLRCDNCGVLMFINKRKGIKLINDGVIQKINVSENNSLVDFIEG